MHDRGKPMTLEAVAQRRSPEPPVPARGRHSSRWRACSCLRSRTARMRWKRPPAAHERLPRSSPRSRPGRF